MTNLGNIAAITKKILPVIIILIIIGVLLFLIYLRNKNQQPPLPLLNKPQTQSLPHQIKDIDSSGLKISENQPKKMLIYSQSLTSNLLIKPEVFAQKLNLSQVKILEIQDKNKGVGKVFADKTGSLSVFAQSLSYQKVGEIPSQKNFDVEFIKKKAASDLDMLGLKSNLSENVKITYSKIQEESILTSTPSFDADLINFIYGYQLGGFPLIHSTQPLSVSYDANGNLFTLRYFLLPEVKVQDEYPIITAQEALVALREAKKPIIKIEPYGDIVASTPNINSINLKSAYLSYVADSGNQSLQPFWVFEGEAKVFNDVISITAAVAAIDPAYFLESQRSKP